MNLYRLRLHWWIQRQLSRFNFNQRLRYSNCGGWWFNSSHGSSAGFVLGYQHGPGAGYIGGWTAYFAINSSSRNWQRRNRAGGSRLPVEIGLTSNANRVPYAN